MSVMFGDSRGDSSSVDDLVIMLSSQEISAPINRQPQVTKVISVPTSEHVAQIVGKSGSKIKNLRTATQTCIKTPLRGDEPVFSVSGTEANVNKVINVIQQASDHFTRLMESRSSACAVGEVTILIPVPQQYVGVVVGRNGSVIMKIKEQTRTRINTPKGDSNTPAFEVTGSQVNVMAAKEAIEDRVKQALMLKDSIVFDPDLSHKFGTDEKSNWPSNSPFLPSTSNQISFGAQTNNNNNKPQLSAIGWPSRSQNRPESPFFRYNPFHSNQFPGLPISPPFMDSAMNSFHF